MKKITLILISMLAVFMIAGCSGNNEGATSQSQTTGETQNTTAEAAQGITETGAAQQNLIGEAKAKEIALKKVSGASEKDIIKFKLDYDDGRQEYEGEIIYNEREYDFEIDAVTGDILSWEEESIYN